MELIKNETIITQSAGGGITLTNCRIMHFEKSMGEFHSTSILLKNVSSVQTHSRSYILLVFLGLLCIGFGLYSLEHFSKIEVLLGLGSGLIFILAYALTKQHLMVVSSKGGAKINILMKRMKHDNVLQFMRELDEAILAFDERLK